MAYLWQTHLSSNYEQQATDAIDESDNKYHQTRTDLLELLQYAPRFVLDVGCSAGYTSKAIKQQFPNATTIGIEIDPEVAKFAEKNVDKLIQKPLEEIDFDAEGITKNSIDTVLFADVLEHMYNPWQTLENLHKLLTPNAQVLISLPNIQNMGIINSLISGKFEYANSGILDITHIRFFTHQSMLQMINETGYEVIQMKTNFDTYIVELFKQYLVLPINQTVNVDLPRFTLKNIKIEDLMKLCVIQYLFVVKPKVNLK